VKADGTRTAIQVGKVAMATAVEIGSHIEHLILCQQSRDDVLRSTREWVEHIRLQWPRLARWLMKLDLISQKAEGATPTSPTRFRNTVISGVSVQKFPLHFALDCFGGQFQTEFFQKDFLMIRGF
jgi:hypothetical protein